MTATPRTTAMRPSSRSPSRSPACRCTPTTVSDSIEDTVDYAEVCQLVALVAQQRSHNTLERLCSTIADRLLADYALEGVWVKAAKPEPPIALSVDEVSVEVWREVEG